MREEHRPTVCPSHDSARVLSCQELPTSIEYGEAIPRRRKEERRAGSASQGMCSAGVVSPPVCGYRGIPARGVVPDRDHSTGSAVDARRDTTAGARRAERAADGSVVDVL